ncbi:hypothetical protein OPV22_007972 [Ensete ventricosum]|uniref:Pentatricopeptide repeat-containing protein n=1 Tax=Ensete ventricosum TaxID=4639 RepID=A0AAV8PV57_ENSVE|nr:hypothetical protein OPV22_007972 [Ensete ventricosum]
MLKDGTRPSSTTFVAVLSAGAHPGWIEEGRVFFDEMSKSYGVTPRAEHLSCMVHLLGRAGHVPEACDLVRAASHIEPDAATWGALLSSCKRRHGYAELADVVAGKMLELDPCHRGAYVQLSSMYASENRWREVVEGDPKGRGVRNRPGWSWVELDGTLHEFLAGVNWHPSMREIYGALTTCSRSPHTCMYPFSMQP